MQWELPNIIQLIFIIISCFLFFFIGFFVIRKKQKERPRIWVAFILLLIGLFSFSVNLLWDGLLLQISILPLGVWLVFLIYYFLDRHAAFYKHQNRWYRHRPYLWLGFFTNYLFLIMMVLAHLLFSLVYPSKQLITFISDSGGASTLRIHNTAETRVFDKQALQTQLHQAQLKQVDGGEWFSSSDPTFNHGEANEKFAYILVGTKAKWGSNLEPLIFVEDNGRGLLIQTEQQQYYFTLDQSIWEEE